MCMMLFVIELLQIHSDFITYDALRFISYLKHAKDTHFIA